MSTAETVRAQAKACVDEMSAGGMSLSMHRFMVMELVSSLYRFAISNRIDTEPVFGEDEALFRNVTNMDAGQLREWLGGVACKMQEQIQSKREDGEQTFVTKAVDYVRDNYGDQELTIDKICGILGVSAAYFSTTFKKETGKTFINYLTDYRMSKARELLMNTEIPITEIALGTGFSDSSYFGKLFRKYYQITPTEYRKDRQKRQSSVFLPRLRRDYNMINGIINVYKERGFTSFDVVAKLRGILHERKIGHTGTLDPEATGVLPVCIGNATKVCELLTDKDKVYRTVMHLGITTDTQDMTGTVKEDRSREAALLKEQTVEAAILQFVGDYEQIPPMYSALKVNGKKLCDLARTGIEVERKARTVKIFSIEIEKINLPYVTMQVHCSKGTYIRTLCADIGEALGVGACMESLVRTRVSVFPLEEAHTLAEIEKIRDEGTLEELILPVDRVFEGKTKLTVVPEAFRFLQNGNRLNDGNFTDVPEKIADGEQVLVYDPMGHFYAVYQYERETKDYKVRKMFGA